MSPRQLLEAGSSDRRDSLPDDNIKVPDVNKTSPKDWLYSVKRRNAFDKQPKISFDDIIFFEKDEKKSDKSLTVSSLINKIIESRNAIVNAKSELFNLEYQTKSVQTLFPTKRAYLLDNWKNELMLWEKNLEKAEFKLSDLTLEPRRGAWRDYLTEKLEEPKKTQQRADLQALKKELFAFKNQFKHEESKYASQPVKKTSSLFSCFGMFQRTVKQPAKSIQPQGPQRKTMP